MPNKRYIEPPHGTENQLVNSLCSLLAEGLRCPTRDVPAFTARRLYAANFMTFRTCGG